jgi:hypothetical protein
MKAPPWDRLWVMTDSSADIWRSLALAWKLLLNLGYLRLSNRTVTFYSVALQAKKSILILIIDYVARS